MEVCIFEFLISLFNAYSGSTIIYCATIKETTNLAAFLSSSNMAAEAYHGSMTPKQRERVHKMFIGGKEEVNIPFMLTLNRRV